MKPIKSTVKKKIISQLNEQFGISELPYLFLQFGKEKIRIFSGSLSREELQTLDLNLNIETIGLYFANQEKDGVRLTMDSLSILKPQISKNTLEITNEQKLEWFKGHELQIKSDKAFKILKHENELIGCGKSTTEKITNFVPKERRIK